MAPTPTTKRARKGVGAKQRRRKKSPLRIDKNHRLRLRILFWSFALVYALIGARLVRLQVDPNLKFSEEDLKHVGQMDIHRPRGDIFDREGRVLATDRLAPSLAVNPSVIDDLPRLSAELSARLDLDKDKLLARFRTRDAKGRAMKFVWVKRWLREEEMASLTAVLETYADNALIIQRETLRYYPENDLASHVLGFANRESVGSEGVELRFDKYLRSEAGHRVSRVDNKRNFLGFLTLEYDPPTGGDDVHLTLDRALQDVLERRLDRAIEENNATRAMGVLMDPRTGAILAMASRPAFDPNHYWDYAPELRKNSALMDVFEPGSAFKIVTAAAALEHGLVTITDEIDCENGSFNPYGHRIRDVHKLEVEPFSTCFAQSSNIAIIKVAALLGPARLESWIRRFGFGKRTGLELPGESPGIFHGRKNWSRLSMGSLPMGQEVAVTTVQLAQAFSVIANGGYLPQPYVVERAVSREGETTYQHTIPQPRRIISDSTSETMRRLCHLVVTGENTGRHAAIAEYRVGGKTGTAQIAKPGGGGYYKDRYTTIFAGFAPVSDPRIVGVIVVSEPMIKNHYGGFVCGPVFRDVVREALVRYSVPEDPVAGPEALIADGLPDSGTDYVAIADTLDPDTVVARVVFDLMEPSYDDEEIDGLELLHARNDSGIQAPALPSFLGMTKRQAKSRLVTLGLSWDPQGAGRVVAQEPRAGTPLNEVRLCRLTFGSAPRQQHIYELND